MKKILVFNFLLFIGLFSFGQQPFADKQAAISWLNETFAAHLIKDASYKGGTYTAELTFSDDLMLFSTTLKTPFKGENVLRVGETDSINLAYSITCNQFKSAPGNLAVTYTGQSKKGFVYKTAYIPFNFPKGSELPQSIQQAFAFIKQKMDEETKVREKELEEVKFREHLAENAAIASNLLPGISVFNGDSLNVNLLDYLKKNRTFNNKPTLLVTWANWCPPCIKQADNVMNSDLAANYNIVLVNKDINGTISNLKEKIAKHSPDYSKGVLVLFDIANQLAPLDKSSAPYFIWLDSQFVVKGAFLGYSISLDSIKKVLQEME